MLFFQLWQKIMTHVLERRARDKIQENGTSCKILLFLILFAWYTMKKICELNMTKSI